MSKAPNFKCKGCKEKCENTPEARLALTQGCEVFNCKIIRWMRTHEPSAYDVVMIQRKMKMEKRHLVPESSLSTPQEHVIPVKESKLARTVFDIMEARKKASDVWVTLEVVEPEFFKMKKYKRANSHARRA